MLTRRLAAGGIASLAGVTLTVQFFLVLQEAIEKDVPVTTAAVMYFSFFTILTNLMIAVCLTFAATEPEEDRIWNWPGVQTALAVYILVVAIVYAAVLQGLWTPSGLEFLTDRVFHAIVPMLYVAYWVFLTPKGSLRLANQIVWQIYPFVYMCYTLVRGALVGTYPYPFLDVVRDGYEGVFFNILLLLLLFLTLGTVLIIVDWLLASIQARGQSSAQADGFETSSGATDW